MRLTVGSMPMNANLCTSMIGAVIEIPARRSTILEILVDNDLGTKINTDNVFLQFDYDCIA